MAKFAKGDKVRIVSHPKDGFRGVEGAISGIHMHVPKAQSSPVTPTTGLPKLAEQVKYDVEIEPYPYLLTYLDEAWLELL